METARMTEQLTQYLNALVDEELSPATIAKYGRDIRFFLACYGHLDTVEKKDVLHYKSSLLQRCKASTVNSYLISLNRYFTWLGQGELAVKTIRRQRSDSLESILTVEEYRQLLHQCASANNQRNYLLLRTIAGTGIRVGELSHITREAAQLGAVEIYHKHKCRTVLLTQELSQLLCAYCREQNIHSGVIFRGRQAGQALCPKSVWKLLKRLAQDAGVDPRKAYPHSLRHLFAKTYMQRVGNVMELADLLGHSSIETTRIYATSSREEKRRSLSHLGL